jgi:hypothetical protein
LIGATLLRLEDSARSASFALRPAQRRRWKNQLETSRSPQDVLSVAISAFGSNQNWPEILDLLKRLNAEDPRIICEIGVADGGTNFLFSHALPHIELMIGIDLFVKGRPRLAYFARPGQRLVYFNGYSQTPEMIAAENWTSCSSTATIPIRVHAMIFLATGSLFARAARSHSMISARIT